MKEEKSLENITNSLKFVKVTNIKVIKCRQSD